MAKPRLTSAAYTVAWICALPLELAQAQVMLDESHDNMHDGGDISYVFGRIGPHNVVMSCLPAGNMGTNSAAAVAAQMKMEFKNIRFGLMVGIGGGVPSDHADIRLGDVVVSIPGKLYPGVVQYDFGQETPNGFRRTTCLKPPPVTLLNAVSLLAASCVHDVVGPFAILKRRPTPSKPVDDDILFEPSYNHEGAATCSYCDRGRVIYREHRHHGEPVVHFGTIASGNRVIRDGGTRDKLSKELDEKNGVLCFEMEAAGLMNYIPCLVIRGICDYADSHKNKVWQPYAAATAAAYAKEILSYVPMADHEDAIARAATIGSIQSAIKHIEFNLLFNPAKDGYWEDFRPSPPSFSIREDPKLCWIFENIDFRRWWTSDDVQILTIFGPRRQDIAFASSWIVDNGSLAHDKTEQQVFCFFFGDTSASKEKPLDSFKVSMLRQIILVCPEERKLAVLKHVLSTLLKLSRNSITLDNEIYKDQDCDIRTRVLLFLSGVSFAQYMNVLADLMMQIQGRLLFVIDGLDHAHTRQNGFAEGLKMFVEGLRRQNPKSQLLITGSQILDPLDLEESLDIVFDVERQECLATLRFDNVRFSKISKAHKGSFTWLWSHNEYQSWSTSNRSQLLYVQGKPGSGKSTLARFFHDNLVQKVPEARSAIVAKFFYSYREGELQTNHCSMLQSILYEVIKQDENFFYDRVQSIYRDCVPNLNRSRITGDFVWSYEVLKEILEFLRDHVLPGRLYLIIDAIDESDASDRRDILDLLIDICTTKGDGNIIKTFIVSRPVTQLDIRRGDFHNFIKLQDHTTQDIRKFASMFVGRLHLEYDLSNAILEYVVNNASGVFLWVELVGKELLEYAEQGDSEENIFIFLRSLPTDLQDFYHRMLTKTCQKPRNLPAAQRLFRWILFTKRPLTENELCHVLGVSENPRESFVPTYATLKRRTPTDLTRFITQCTGNLLEIRNADGEGALHLCSALSLTSLTSRS